MLDKHDKENDMSRTVISSEVVKNPKSNMKEFLYSFATEEGDGSEFEDTEMVPSDELMVMIVDKDFYEETGYIADWHISDEVASNTSDPDIFNTLFIESMESHFESWSENISKQQVHEYFATQPNFTYQPSLGQ